MTITSCISDYSMYSTFLTASPGSVLFSRSNLLKRKDLRFSWLRLGLVRHRRSLRSSLTPFLKCLPRFSCHSLDLARPHFGVHFMTSSLSTSLFYRFSSAPDPSLIFLQSLELWVDENSGGWDKEYLKCTFCSKALRFRTYTVQWHMTSQITGSGKHKSEEAVCSMESKNKRGMSEREWESEFYRDRHRPTSPLRV